MGSDIDKLQRKFSQRKFSLYLMAIIIILFACFY